MSAAEAIALVPADAVELRIIRYRVRKGVAQGASEWLGDALMGSDAGPSDGQRPLRTGTAHWITRDRGAVAYEVPGNAEFSPDDVARLLAEARRRGLRAAMWTENNRLGGGDMELTESWFTGAAVAPTSGLVQSAVEPDGVTVTVEERVAPKRAWLLMLPVLIVTFAWVFFLVIGGLPKMIRNIWQLGVTGQHRRLVVRVDADTVRIEVTGTAGAGESGQSGSDQSPIVIERSRFVALGRSGGLRVYTTDGAIRLPEDWATTQLTDKLALSPSVVAAVNNAVGAS